MSAAPEVAVEDLASLLAGSAYEDIARRSATLIRALRESIEMSERITADHGAENTPALRSAVAWIAGHLHQNGDPAMAELFDNLLQVTS